MKCNIGVGQPYTKMASNCPENGAHATGHLKPKAVWIASTLLVAWLGMGWPAQAIQINYIAAGLAVPPLVPNGSGGYSPAVHAVVPISWITSVPASSQIEYGPTESYGTTIQVAVAPNYQLYHSTTIFNNISSPGVYYYKATVTDSDGNYATSTGTFTTYTCGDNSCDSQYGESELTCPRDCRMNSCQNVLGAFGVGDQRSWAVLASQLGIQSNYSASWSSDITDSDTAFYGFNHLQYFVHFVYKMETCDPIDASTSTIAVCHFTQDGPTTFSSSPITPLPATLSIEWEEIVCSSFTYTDTSSSFTDCIRGSNNTYAVSHPSGTVILDGNLLITTLQNALQNPASGYYVLGDLPIKRPKYVTNYQPALQKEYLLIKQYDKVHPVVANDTVYKGGVADIGLAYIYPVGKNEGYN